MPVTKRKGTYAEVMLENEEQTQATTGFFQDGVITRPCIYVWYRSPKDLKRTAAYLAAMMPPYAYPTAYRNGYRFFLRLVEVSGKLWEIHIDNEDTPERAQLADGYNADHVWGGSWTFTVFDESTMPNFERQVQETGGAALFIIGQKLVGDDEGRLDMAAFAKSVAFMGWIRNVKVIWRSPHA